MIWVDQVPLIGVFVATMVLVLVALTVGFAIASWQRKRGREGAAETVGSAVGAMLGLLAFILAFTFGTTSSRFDTRKALLLDEANAIGTAALRTDLLPAPFGADCKDLLTRYVDIRARPQVKAKDLPQLVADSEKVLDQLWGVTASLADAELDPETRALFIESVNEVIDLHTSRVTVGMHYRIPQPVWVWLIGATAAAMIGVGYHFGLSGHRRILIWLLLAGLFASIVLLITDLDRGAEGTLRVNSRPLLDLQKKLHGEDRSTSIP